MTAFKDMPEAIPVYIKPIPIYRVFDENNKLLFETSDEGYLINVCEDNYQISILFEPIIAFRILKTISKFKNQ